MLWLNIELKDLENEAFGCAESLDWGIWLKLTRYCCSQENGGRIKGAKNWDAKKISWVLRLEKAELERKSTLWRFTGNDLLVGSYPIARQREMARLRSQAKTAAQTRWNRVRSGMPTGISTDASRHAEAMPDAVRTAPNGNAERKGKEGKGKEGKGSSALCLVASSPPEKQAVETFFVTAGAPADLAADFYDTFSANKWTQGGRPEAPLAAWEPEASKWVRRWKRSASEKKSHSDGGAAGALVQFDPQVPNAHTGGIPPAN